MSNGYFRGPSGTVSDESRSAQEWAIRGISEPFGGGGSEAIMTGTPRSREDEEHHRIDSSHGR